VDLAGAGGIGDNGVVRARVGIDRHVMPEIAAVETVNRVAGCSIEIAVGCVVLSPRLNDSLVDQRLIMRRQIVAAEFSELAVGELGLSA
jgi:hypothetical protein